MEFGEERVVYKVMELFSPPRVTAEIMTGGYRNIGHTEPAAFDKDCGWDFFDAQDRKMFWQCFEEQQPDLNGDHDPGLPSFQHPHELQLGSHGRGREGEASEGMHDDVPILCAGRGRAALSREGIHPGAT